MNVFMSLYFIKKYAVVYIHNEPIYIFFTYDFYSSPFFIDKRIILSDYDAVVTLSTERVNNLSKLISKK